LGSRRTSSACASLILSCPVLPPFVLLEPALRLPLEGGEVRLEIHELVRAHLSAAPAKPGRGSPSQLAEVLGVSPATIHDWLKRKG
jgi:hypothetical protein